MDWGWGAITTSELHSVDNHVVNSRANNAIDQERKSMLRLFPTNWFPFGKLGGVTDYILIEIFLDKLYINWV